MLEDLERGKGRLAIRMTDLDAFEVGRNIATTPGQGRVPERADAADPVRADDRAGAPAAADDHAALDQQVLHPRPAAEEQLHQVLRRPGLHDLRPVLGQPGRAAQPQVLRGLHARGAAGGARRDRAGDRREGDHRHRLLPGRHAAGLARWPRWRPSATTGSRPHLLHHPGRLQRTRASSACSSTRSSSAAIEEQHGQARLSRRRRDGDAPSTCCAPTT